MQLDLPKLISKSAQILILLLFMVCMSPANRAALGQEMAHQGTHSIDSNGVCVTCQNLTARRPSMQPTGLPFNPGSLQDVPPSNSDILPGPAGTQPSYYKQNGQQVESLGPALDQADQRAALPNMTVGNPNGQSIACPGCGNECPVQTCTIYVPYWETNYQTVWDTRYRMEPRFTPYTVYKTLTHKVPETVDYTVMVPQQKTVQFTTYKTFEEREPVVQNYQIFVPVQKKRKITTYRTEILKQDVAETYTVMVPDVRERKIQYYRTVPRERKITKEYTVYRDVDDMQPVKQYAIVAKQGQPVQKEIEVLEPVVRERVETYYVREPVTRNETQTVERVIAYTEDVEKTVTERVPIVDQVERKYEVMVPVKKEVLKKYYVIVPRYRTVEQEYTIQVPSVENRQATRTVYKQVPHTYYRVHKQDCGYWKTITETVCQPACGNRGECSSCDPVYRTVCRKVWCPNVVTRKIPCTVYKTVPQKIPYTYPVTVMKTEKRVRRYPIVQYVKEERTYKDTEYTYNKETRSEFLSIASAREIQKKITVPVQKYRKVPQEIQVPITEFRNVPKQKTVTYTELVKRKKTITVPVVEYEKVEREVQQPVKVKKAFTEQRTTTVTEYVNEVAYKTESYTVMIPKTMVRNVPKTVYKKVPEYSEVSYTVMVPETRTRTVYKTSYKRVPELNERVYTVMVPEKRTRIVYRTVTRQVPEQKLRRHIVHVPFKVPRLIPQKTCKLVPKTIQVPTQQCGCNHQAHHDIQQVGDAYGRLLNQTISGGFKQFARKD